MLRFPTVTSAMRPDCIENGRRTAESTAHLESPRMRDTSRALRGREIPRFASPHCGEYLKRIRQTAQYFETFSRCVAYDACFAPCALRPKNIIIIIIVVIVVAFYRGRALPACTTERFPRGTAGPYVLYTIITINVRARVCRYRVYVYTAVLRGWQLSQFMRPVVLRRVTKKYKIKQPRERSGWSLGGIYDVRFYYTYTYIHIYIYI